MRYRTPSLLSILLIAPLLLAGCNGEVGPTDPSAAVGVYNLYQVNGQSPPVLVDQDQTGRLDVLGGSITLRSDRTFTETADLQITPSSGAAQPPRSNSIQGTFRLVGRTVEFRPDGTTPFMATLAGDTLRYTIGDFDLTYVR